MYLFSSDELKTYDHSACDIKVKIVIDFSNDMDLSVFFKSNIEHFTVKNMDLKKKSGVNKNISIFMLFDCMGVNTGLGSH